MEDLGSESGEDRTGDSDLPPNFFFLSHTLFDLSSSLLASIIDNGLYVHSLDAVDGDVPLIS